MIKRGIQFVLCLCLTMLFILWETGWKWREIALGIVLSVCLFLGVMYLECVVDRVLERKRDAWHMCVYFVIMLAAYSLMIVLAVNRDIVSYPDIFAVLFIASVCLTAAVGWILGWERMNRREERRHEELLRTAAVGLDTENCYEKIKEHRQQVSFLRHDMLNRLRKTAGASSSPEEEALLEQIRQEIKKTTRVQYCEHPGIDVTLTRRIYRLHETGIFPEVEVRLSELGKIDDVPVTMLLHNLFDYVETSISGERRLQLRLYNDRKFHGRNRIYIYIRMSTDGKRSRSLRNRQLRMAQKLVKSMGGSLNYEQEEKFLVIGGILEVER